jgi:hypothetical protein
MGSNQGDPGIHGHSRSSNPCFRCPTSERVEGWPGSSSTTFCSLPLPRSRLRTSRAPKSPSGAGDLNPRKIRLISGAIEGTRTPTPLPVHGPEPCASANSATMASGLQMRGSSGCRIRRSAILFYKRAACCQRLGAFGRRSQALPARRLRHPKRPRFAPRVEESRAQRGTQGQVTAVSAASFISLCPQPSDSRRPGSRLDFSHDKHECHTCRGRPHDASRFLPLQRVVQAEP